VFACLDGDGGDDGDWHYFKSEAAAREFIADGINPVEGWCLQNKGRAGMWSVVDGDFIGATERDL
jgi:hypothetical protein